MPSATDVRSFMEWQAAGRSVKKSEKALRAWVPKLNRKADEERERDGQQPARFILGPVFDVSQTEPTARPRRSSAWSLVPVPRDRIPY